MAADPVSTVLQGNKVASPTTNVFMMLRAPTTLNQPLNGRDFRDFIKDVCTVV